MIRTLSTLIAIAAIAGPAAAQEVTINVAGKDARTISVEIDKAAWAVCAAAFQHGDVGFHEIADCAKSAADDGQAELKAAPVAETSSAVAVARNDLEAASSR